MAGSWIRILTLPRLAGFVFSQGDVIFLKRFSIQVTFKGNLTTLLNGWFNLRNLSNLSSLWSKLSGVGRCRDFILHYWKVHTAIAHNSQESWNLSTKKILFFQEQMWDKWTMHKIRRHVGIIPRQAHTPEPVGTTAMKIVFVGLFFLAAGKYNSSPKELYKSIMARGFLIHLLPIFKFNESNLNTQQFIHTVTAQ